MQTINKDPDSVETFTVPWARRLLPAVTISTSVFTSTPAGLTVVGPVGIDGQNTTAKLSGGTLAVTYEVVNRITTSDGQTLDFHFQIFIKSETD